MTLSRSPLSLADWLCLGICGALSALWCLGAAGELGATFDEPIYLQRGLEGWRAFSHGGLLAMGTMPLPTDVQTLPLYLAELWRGHPFNPAEDMEILLPWMRAGSLAFWVILLYHALLLGNALAGPWAGRLAVALLACEPTLLAHASLATTDLAVSACLLALLYNYRAGRDDGWKRRVLVPSLWFAATVLAKASGLLFGTIALLAVEAERYLRTPRKKLAESDAVWRRFSLPATRNPLPAVLGLGLLVVILYCGTDAQPQASFARWAHELPEGGAACAILVPLADNLRIFPNAFDGFARQFRHNCTGHGTYLLGHSEPRSFWYYFPVVLTIKLSAPFLLLPMFVAVVRPRALLNLAAATAFALLVVSLAIRVQIGVRLVLPLVALGGVGLAVSVAHARKAIGWRRRFVTLGTIAGLTWTSLSAAAVWPNGLCYANELWGGTAQAFRWVSDANFDWGQGLKQLHAWQQQYDVDGLHVWYYGTDRHFDRLPFASVQTAQGSAGVRAQAGGGYLAVSATLLHGPLSDLPEHRPVVEFLRQRRPMTRTMTFFIYDFTREPTADGSSEWCED